MKRILLFSLLLTGITVSAQKISNKISFPKGNKLEVTTETSSIISIDMMGQKMDTKVNGSLTRMLDIEDVSKGTATIEHKVKHLKVNYDIPMRGIDSFDSENESDMKGEGGKAMEKALKNKYKMVVDQWGKVVSVQADDNNPNTDAPKGDMMADMITQMSDGMTLPKPGDASEFSILPAREISKGGTWTDTTGGKNFNYTLSDVTDSDLIINFTGTSTTRKTQEANGMEMVISSKDNSTGTILLDRKTGLVKEKTETISSDGTMEMMGQSIPMKTNITKKITVTGL